ncbi:RLA class I histocompatibility antigen, alpha chain 11/11-like [Pristis pectinata]|uniref:RLA class I histocompatibility antigen, alpha chain 11/11-like n=1 Tax=Pristis pectinata TaxID=685728 RepID=UPI00223D062C|nr:RLA class I histocompatibility antigen, alpha chain 11/11-like [Pristis pectinata]
MESWNGPASLLFTVLSLCSGPGSQAGSHSLMYFYLQTVNIPDLPDFSRVGMLDDLQIDYYDSTLEEVETSHQWIADGLSAEYRKEQKEITDKLHQLLSMHLKQIGSFLSISYIQGIWGCTQSGIMFNAILKFNIPHIGEISCNIAKEKCTGTGLLAMFNDQLNLLSAIYTAELKSSCSQYLQRALQLAEGVLEMQVAPELQVLTRKPTATEGQSLLCIITPFYPRAINATWLKNGQVVSEGYKVTVLPNYNDMYWMELVIELQGNNPEMYTCQVQHSSLPETLMLKGGVGEPRGAGPMLGLMAVLAMVIGAV